MKNFTKQGPFENLQEDGSIDAEYNAYHARMKEQYDEFTIDNMNIYNHNYHQFTKLQEPRNKMGINDMYIAGKGVSFTGQD
jgi:hypothetical protein